MKTVLKVLTALAAVAGVVYVAATYGDKIVAWAKNIVASCPFCNKCDVVEEAAPVEVTPEEEPAEITPVDEEIPVEIVIEGNEPVAEEADFEA